MHSGFDIYVYGNRGYTNDIGWFPGAGTGQAFGGGEPLRFGLFAQNNLKATNDGIVYQGVNANGAGSGSAQYYADPDGVIRRATAAYVPYTAGSAPATTTVGLPEATAMSYPSPSTGTGVGKATSQSQSRPIVLNRPFRSVAELGYVYKGIPWKNLDFFTPSSGDTALLDVFCINEPPVGSALTAGKVNLNTRQAPVLQAILSGAYKDETNSFVPAPSNTPLSPISGTTESLAIAQGLVLRASSQPLRNVGELVGSWTSGGTLPSPTNPVDGMAAYSGFSGTDSVSPTDPLSNLTTIFKAAPFSGDSSISNIQRFRESAVRPLAAVGTTRTWNLMIDLIAQSGRYPTTATTLDKFIVDGEQHYWVHIAIDRYTGEVIDKQIEVVKE